MQGSFKCFDIDRVMWQEVWKAASSWGPWKKQNLQVHNSSKGESREFMQIRKSFMLPRLHCPLPNTFQQLQIVTSWQEIRRVWLRENRISPNDFGRRGRNLERGRSWVHINHWTQSPFPSMQKGQLWAVIYFNSLTFPFFFLLRSCL